MTKLETLKTKIADAGNKALGALTEGFVVILGGILACGILTLGFTLGLTALGIAMLLLLIALPFGGLRALRERPVRSA